MHTVGGDGVAGVELVVGLVDVHGCGFIDAVLGGEHPFGVDLFAGAGEGSGAAVVLELELDYPGVVGAGAADDLGVVVAGGGIGGGF